jgi:hypothetical protein
LIFEHKLPIDGVERMLPWERNIFMDMMKDYIEKQNEAMRK